MDTRGKPHLKKNKKSTKILQIIKNLLAAIITIGLMIYLVFKVKPSNLTVAFNQVDIGTILLVVLLSIVLIFVKVLRWMYVLHKLAISLSFFQVLRLVLIGSFGAAVTPAKIGDVVRAHYLSKWYETKEVTSYFSAILDRTTDLISIGLFSLIAIPFFVIDLPIMTKWAFSIGILLLTMMLVLVFNSRIIKILLNLFFKLRKRRKTDENISIDEKPRSIQLVDDYYSHLSNFNSKSYIILLCFSFLFWIILGLQISLLISSMASLTLGLSVFLSTTSIVSIAAIVSLVPFSISGIGIRDATFTFLMFYSLQIFQEVGLSTSIIQTLLNMIIPALIGGMLLLISKRIKKKTNGGLNGT